MQLDATSVILFYRNYFLRHSVTPPNLASGAETKKKHECPSPTTRPHRVRRDRSPAARQAPRTRKVASSGSSACSTAACRSPTSPAGGRHILHFIYVIDAILASAAPTFLTTAPRPLRPTGKSAAND